MARRLKGSLSKNALYNFIKVKGSEAVLNFNHDPAKNASSVIFKFGTGTAATSLGNAAGKVKGGFVYYLDDGVWTPTHYSGESYMGAGNLLGIALGRFAKYDGTPTEVGMLISGVTTTAIFGSLGTNGVPLYGTHNAYGRMVLAAPTGAGRVVQKLGWALDQQLTTVDGVSYAETIVLFRPAWSYTILS